ncbi:EAL domain-containing protein [Frankia sp. QA3]|uniref:sensor domain-containing protein n=1 Tax=Frankia sp. QA3 TaxID=710111 RepID=UPI000269C3D1|nr:EAL domain-containing protein [Frankia sp. QA3]EIV93392.1 PAS domain S-box/diguanylate cyclase (GGDEF) domain-containing protein [Frankia sp. QA3]
MTQERPDLFELLNLAVTVTDLRTGRLRRANAAACNLLGQSEAELVGTYWQDVTVPEERALWHEEIHRPGRHQPPSRRLVRLRRPDHSTVHVLVTSATVPGPAGREILSQLQDVSDEITANDRLRLILDHTPVSMFLMDRAGLVLASEGLLDATLTRLTEHPDVSVFTLFEDLPDAVGLVRAALDGHPVHDVLEAFGRYFDLHLIPIEGPDGEVSYLTCVATDVTEHQQALATLRTRSDEQAMVADLGQQALESLDATTMWTHAARILAEHLTAGTVRIHELDDAGQRTRILADVSADPARTTHTDPARTDPAWAGGRRTDGAWCPPRPATRTTAGGHDLVVATGRGDRPLAVVEVSRPSPAPAFSEQDAQFVRSVGAVLGAAAVRFRMEDEIRRQSLRDGLTGLPNRTALLDRLDRALRRARGDGTRIGVLFIDLDGFKTVNDTLGHQAGDHLLRLTADRLEHAVRPADVVGRLSGDEFAVLCENIDSPAAVEAIADRVLATLDTPCMLRERTILLSASVGIALSEPETADGEDLLNAADIAMYAAKRRGPGRRLAFDEVMRTRLIAQITENDELRRAVSADELVMRYQPIQDIDRGLAGAQALPHWRHPRRGLVPPAQFLPEPAHVGLRVPIDRWAVGRACRAAARWEGVPGDGEPPPLLAVTVSGRCLVEPRFIPELDVLLAATGADIHYRLCLQIPEGEVADDEPALLAAFGELRRLGVDLCIGDYGSARTMASAMNRVPFGYIRLSGTYVDGVDLNPVRHAASGALIHFAHELGIQTMAGDVATTAQLDTLRALRCDLLLGPMIGPSAARLPRLTGRARARGASHPGTPSRGR